MNNTNQNNGNQSMETYFFRAAASDFMKIPGNPIAYWASNVTLSAFDSLPTISDFAKAKSGQNTGDNARFLRQWPEVPFNRIGFGFHNLEETNNGQPKWFPYNKGGNFRKWYGNFENVINWSFDGQEIKEYAVQRNNGKHWSRYIQNLDLMLKEGVTWTFISSSYFGARYTPAGHLFDYAGCSAFTEQEKIPLLVSVMCAKTSEFFLKLLNPTLNLQPGNVSSLPVPDFSDEFISTHLLGLTNSLIEISKTDWNSHETSWDFTTLHLLQIEHQNINLQDTYIALRRTWQEITFQTKNLEEENNRIFIEAYGLQDELTPDVPLKEITLTCNPHYRYGGNKTEEELEALLLADTMREFISYAVGCMFGRYSLDKPGLVLANQGETLADYLKQVPNPRFTPDKDNVIPLLDGDWFADDITERFRQFLRVTFGEEHYEENLDFIEKAIGKDIRKFFLRDFYNDHVKRYKKRPIYWLFSSPKGTFNALIYLHRYKPDTISIVLRYLREFREKLESRLNHLQQVSISTSASQAEKTRSLKEIDALKKQLLELDDYERNTLYPLATQQIAIDLDDGVKVNYLKFGPALKKIVGLESKDED